MTTRQFLTCGRFVILLGWLPLGAAAEHPGDPVSTLGLINYTRPAFPVLASSQGVFEGAVWVAVDWNEDGSARDVIVLGSTHPALGRTVAETVATWRRDPERKSSLGDNFVVEFRAEGVVIAGVGPSGAPVAANLRMMQVPGRAELDEAPTAVAQPMPALPVRRAKEKAGGRVVVTFYVDENGQVRAPRILETSSPEFAAATLEALRQWRYEPAKRKGRPTIFVDSWAFDFRRG